VSVHRDGVGVAREGARMRRAVEMEMEMQDILVGTVVAVVGLVGLVEKQVP